MWRLNTVIASLDKHYVESLMNFFIDNNSSNFQINSFTKKELFKEFVEKNHSNIDVIVTDEEFYYQELENIGIKLVCLLSDGKEKKEYKNCEILDKYMLAQSIADNILRLYSQKTDLEFDYVTKNDCKVLAIFSPISGSGKTTIAYGLSLTMANLGSEVFYLNFEESASTSTFFDTAGTEDLSTVLFYLKAKAKNMGIKIDSVKKRDPKTGISYFNPVKGSLELEEITSNEYIALLNELKHYSKYDYLVIDLSSSFSSKIANVLNIADKILMPFVDQIDLSAKTRSALNDFEILRKRDGINLHKKLLLIQNKFMGESKLSESFSFKDISISHVLDYEKTLYIQDEDKFKLRLDGKFGKTLENILLQC